MTVSSLSCKGVGQFVHNAMLSFQNTKKQTEELNSSKTSGSSSPHSACNLPSPVSHPGMCISDPAYLGKWSPQSSETRGLCPSYGGPNDSDRKRSNLCCLSVQSGNVGPKPTTSTEQEQNVAFEGAETVIADIPHAMKYVNVDSSYNVDLGSFLKRPVEIASYDWDVGSTIGQGDFTFSPWSDFFSKPSITRKLDNYYMLRCNLHLKIVINASPFYYGCALASYRPMPNFNPCEINWTLAGDLALVPLSQRPHIYIYPQDSQGGEMVLPFLYQKNWLNATSASELSSMGTVDVASFAQLKNANGISSGNINIVVYAWAEDIEVAGPTISLAVQSGEKDEYSHVGTVSRPASAIARAANMFSSVPVIGPFATATSHAAGAIANLAALFGYTNVPVIDDVHAVRVAAFPNFAATDIGTPVDKLTLDAKNELSIDPSITGVNLGDELLISNFCSRESYIFSSDWTTSDSINTGLFYAKVSPMLTRTKTATLQEAFWDTPMAHVSRNFLYWRGDVIFRFKFICSAYHRGRVRINWDPVGAIGVQGDYTTETYTRVVDISDETDVSICVPFTQPTAYLQTEVNANEYFGKTGTSVSDLGKHFNGTLTVRVLTNLTSPTTAADITMLVFAKGADNLEFAGPTGIPKDMSPYIVQSAELDISLSEHCVGVRDSVADPNMNLIYMGEHIPSLRQLMRRNVQYMRVVYPITGLANTISQIKTRVSRSPLYPGYDSSGMHNAIGQISGLSEPYNWVTWSTATWMSCCFVGSRGSYMYSINASAEGVCQNVRLLRASLSHNRVDYQTGGLFVGAGPAFQSSIVTDTDATGMAGQAITNQHTQAGVTALVPMYSRYKFLSNDPLTRSEGTDEDGSDKDTLLAEVTAYDRSGVSNDFLYADMYTSIGTDFNLVFFLNVPVMYQYDALPTAA